MDEHRAERQAAVARDDQLQDVRARGLRRVRHDAQGDPQSGHHGAGARLRPLRLARPRWRSSPEGHAGGLQPVGVRGTG